MKPKKVWILCKNKPKKVWRVTEQMPDGTWNEWDTDYDTRRQAKLAIRAMGKDKTKTLVAPFLKTVDITGETIYIGF